MNILITGASSGIGAGIKNLFIASGHSVYSFARSYDGSNSNEIKCDITNENELCEAINKIKTQCTCIDVLINNAGYGLHGATELLSMDEIRRQFEVNFFAQINVIQKTLPLMRAGAKIINISSVCAFFPLPYRAFYCASKSAFTALSYSLSMELAQSNIQVATICPGDIKTNFVNTRVKHFETNERYGDRVEASNKKVDSKNEKRMTLEYASKKIYKIINKNRLKNMYIIGKKYKFLYYLSKIFGINLFLKATNKMFN